MILLAATENNALKCLKIHFALMKYIKIKLQKMSVKKSFGLIHIPFYDII